MKTLIVMPARNEAETIGAVIGRLKAVVPDADILVVNDASTDNTAEVAAKAGAKVVNLPINLGYGGAVQTGFKYAARHDYDAVVLMDADGQHDPACVPDLLKAFAGCRFCFGFSLLRRMPLQSPDCPPHRHVALRQNRQMGDRAENHRPNLRLPSVAEGGREIPR
jgi:glycosyltransferase involved in cell wall biosynthesis